MDENSASMNFDQFPTISLFNDKEEEGEEEDKKGEETPQECSKIPSIENYSFQGDFIELPNTLNTGHEEICLLSKNTDVPQDESPHIYPDGEVRKGELESSPPVTKQRQQTFSKQKRQLYRCYETTPKVDYVLQNMLLKAFEEMSVAERVTLINEELEKIRLHFHNQLLKHKIWKEFIREWFRTHPTYSSLMGIFMNLERACCRWHATSTGILFYHQDKHGVWWFLAVENKKGYMSAYKGHAKWKENGECEHPDETARRETIEEIIPVARNQKNQLKLENSWSDGLAGVIENAPYVECTFPGIEGGKNRTIGIFQVELVKKIRFKPGDTTEITAVTWFRLFDDFEGERFYTLLPFIQDLRARLTKGQ